MRKLIIALLGVLVLLVVADVVTRQVAESALADHIDSREEVTGTNVEIHGASFLIQAARSQFGEIDVEFPTLRGSSGVGALDLQVDDVTLTLHDVKTSNSFSRAVAQRVEGAGTVPYDEITRRLGIASVGYDEETGGIVVSS